VGSAVAVGAGVFVGGEDVLVGLLGCGVGWMIFLQETRKPVAVTISHRKASRLFIFLFMDSSYFSLWMRPVVNRQDNLILTFQYIGWSSLQVKRELIEKEQFHQN
jgi:hypothetical protein